MYRVKPSRLEAIPTSHSFIRKLHRHDVLTTQLSNAAECILCRCGLLHQPFLRRGHGPPASSAFEQLAAPSKGERSRSRPLRPPRGQTTSIFSISSSSRMINYAGGDLSWGFRLFQVISGSTSCQRPISLFTEYAFKPPCGAEYVNVKSDRSC